MQTDAVLDRRADLVPVALLRLASDQRLVGQVRTGSERAFEALFDRHHRPVLAFCRHMLGSKEEAEDVVQLTFLAAYRDLRHTDPPVALRPWLYAIARHRCLSVLRARRERPVAEVRVPATDWLAAELTTRQDLRAILADVAQLPDDQRAALVLAELGDVSHEQIASILVCPRAKVKALVFQARSSLVASRAARETPCADIREQLATLRGGALRRTTLRRHLHDCAACRAFREQVRVQRRALGLLLPVAPGVGLKRMVLGAAFGSGANGAGGAALTAVALNWGGLAAALVVLAIPAGATTAIGRAVGDRGDAPHVTSAAQRAAPASAVPRSEQARPERNQPGPAVLSLDGTQPRKRPVQVGGNAKGADPAEPATSSRQAEPARPHQAVASEPVMANGQTAPATPPQIAPAASGQRQTPTDHARKARQAAAGQRPTPTDHARKARQAAPGQRPTHTKHAATGQRPAHARRAERPRRGVAACRGRRLARVRHHSSPVAPAATPGGSGRGGHDVDGR